MEETFTDKEFCAAMKIDRATSLRWRDQGIVGFLKLPNGQIRYLREHIEALKTKFAKSAAQGSNDALKGSVVDISVAKRGSNVGMA